VFRGLDDVEGLGVLTQLLPGVPALRSVGVDQGLGVAEVGVDDCGLADQGDEFLGQTDLVGVGGGGGDFETGGLEGLAGEVLGSALVEGFAHLAAIVAGGVDVEHLVGGGRDQAGGAVDVDRALRGESFRRDAGGGIVRGTVARLPIGAVRPLYTVGDRDLVVLGGAGRLVGKDDDRAGHYRLDAAISAGEDLFRRRQAGGAGRDLLGLLLLFAGLFGLGFVSGRLLLRAGGLGRRGAVVLHLVDELLLVGHGLALGVALEGRSRGEAPS